MNGVNHKFLWLTVSVTSHKVKNQPSSDPPVHNNTSCLSDSLLVLQGKKPTLQLATSTQ